MATTKLMTAEDLWELGDSGNCRRELVRGELREMPLHVEEHGALTALIGAHLVLHVRQNQLGTVCAGGTGCILHHDPDTVLAPDVAFVRAGRLPDDRDRSKFIESSPDLIVEVVAPSDLYSEFTEKLIIYLDTWVHNIWIIEPYSKIVMIYSPDDAAKILTIDDELDGGDVLPGFRIPVSELFS